MNLAGSISGSASAVDVAFHVIIQLCSADDCSGGLRKTSTYPPLPGRLLSAYQGFSCSYVFLLISQNSICLNCSFGMCILELATLEYPYAECHSVPQIFKKVTLVRRERRKEVTGGWRINRDRCYSGVRMRFLSDASAGSLNGMLSLWLSLLKTA